MSTPTHIAAFYAFRAIPEDQLEALRTELRTFGDRNDLRGLVLLATEGINGTVCGAPDVITQWKELIMHHFGPLHFNDATADAHVFPRWYVKIRPEIVTLKDPDVAPQGERRHLSPAEWHRMMEEEDVIVLDTRNDYETAIGVFDGAVDPKLRQFQEFGTFVRSANLPKDKKIMMYCTGGIRCEKAIIEMEKHGYTNVFQLKGGILQYLKEFPHGKFKGECFVFDHRVAVDQELQPSRTYALCPHCGDPAPCAVTCEVCASSTKVCGPCHAKHLFTCSKACRARLLAVRA